MGICVSVVYNSSLSVGFLSLSSSLHPYESGIVHYSIPCVMASLAKSIR